MSANQAVHRIATMCRVLGVSTSGYYAWRGRSPSRRAISDAALPERILAIHKFSRETYGAPRIFEELKAEGVHVGRKRIARLMKRAGLQGVSRRRSTWTTRRDKDAQPAPDLVSFDRAFSVLIPEPDNNVCILLSFKAISVEAQAWGRPSANFLAAAASLS